MLPRDCIAGAKVPTVMMQSDRPRRDLLLWLAAANSFAMDFLVRMKVSLTMALTILDSLPFPRLPAGDASAQAIVERALRLTCTGPEMDALWDEMAQSGVVPARKSTEIPGAVDATERLHARAEIEARLALLYGLQRDELAHVLDTFPIVQKDDEKAHGEYRTKRVILEMYDAMAEAARTGKPYQTRVDPPPADPRVAHADARAQGQPQVIRELQTKIRVMEGGRANGVVTELPVYDLRAVAGPFDAAHAAGTARLVRVRASRLYERRKGTFFFVAPVTGRSMEPEIPDGSLCIFRRPAHPTPGSRVLVRRQSPEDPERGGRFVVKEYRPGKHGACAQLVSLNPAYPPFSAGEDDVIEATWVETVELAEENVE